VGWKECNQVEKLVPIYRETPRRMDLKWRERLDKDEINPRNSRLIYEEIWRMKTTRVKALWW
jgi:hypothetical protein